MTFLAEHNEIAVFAGGCSQGIVEKCRTGCIRNRVENGRRGKLRSMVDTAPHGGQSVLDALRLATTARSIPPTFARVHTSSIPRNLLASTGSDF